MLWYATNSLSQSVGCSGMGKPVKRMARRDSGFHGLDSIGLDQLTACTL